MPTGTRPFRPLSLHVVNLGGEQLELRISSEKRVRHLHHAVRKLTKETGEFNIVHNKWGTIFGLVADFGSTEWRKANKRKLCNLRVRTGDTISMTVLAPRVDTDGNDMPPLCSDSESLESTTSRDTFSLASNFMVLESSSHTGKRTFRERYSNLIRERVS